MANHTARDADGLDAADAPHEHAEELAVDTTPEAFLSRWVYDNPALAERRALFLQWFTSSRERSEIAQLLGVPLGSLLRSFNETAPLSPALPFCYRRALYSVIAMAGVCDDVAGERFPLFGAPLTLRCYVADAALLPQGMYEAADWNYMDAGLPGFVSYAYGVRHQRTLYLAGLQSDLAVRYAYLFQGHGGITAVRRADEVVSCSTNDLIALYGPHVATLRRLYQRYWISVLLGAAVTWALDDGSIDALGLLQFATGPEEARRGHVVQRVYDMLPERLGARPRYVRVAGKRHCYAVAELDSAIAYLGERWERGWRGTA
jgi:hypothetical protein